MKLLWALRQSGIFIFRPPIARFGKAAGIPAARCGIWRGVAGTWRSKPIPVSRHDGWVCVVIEEGSPMLRTASVFSKQIKRIPAEMDLSGLPAAKGFGFELRIKDTTPTPSTPILDAVRVSFQ